MWPTAWLYDVLKWTSNEIDWPEEYGGKIHGNLHPGNAGIAVAIPADCDTAWHEYRMDWTTSGCTFYIDGTKVGAASGAVAGPMALVADAKIGLDVPDASTPATSVLRIAAGSRSTQKPWSVHSWILAIALSWAGLDIAILLLLMAEPGSWMTSPTR